jgi:hypothetical protein
VEHLAITLERLTGAVEGANLCDSCVVYCVVAPVMAPLLAVQRAFRHHALVQRLLFALAAAMAREHSGLPRRDGAPVGPEVRAACIRPQPLRTRSHPGAPARSYTCSHVRDPPFPSQELAAWSLALIEAFAEHLRG